MQKIVNNFVYFTCNLRELNELEWFIFSLFCDNEKKTVRTDVEFLARSLHHFGPLLYRFMGNFRRTQT
jgi:hypothetical protein